jgi:hypothetical protein
MNKDHLAEGDRTAVSEEGAERMRAEFMAWVRDRGCDTDGAWSAWQGCWNLFNPSGAREGDAAQQEGGA